MKQLRHIKTAPFIKSHWLMSPHVPCAAAVAYRPTVLMLTIATVLGVIACNGSTNANPAESGGSSNTGGVSSSVVSSNTGGAGVTHVGGTTASLATSSSTASSQSGGAGGVGAGGNSGSGGTTQTATQAVATGGNRAVAQTTAPQDAGSTCVEHVHTASGKQGTNCASCHKPACNCFLSALDAELTCPR